MRLLVFNQDWFVREFRDAGHEVMTCGFREHMDFRQNRPLEHVHDLLQRLPNKFQPDCIIIYDESSPFLVTGWEDLEIPILFYSVDTHHHAQIHRHLANAFDYTFIAQRDYMPKFAEVGAEAAWLPLWASRYFEPSAEKDHGAVFVGTLDAKLNPDRVAFFDALKKCSQIFCTTGYFWQIFPRSEVVINQTVKGDLNFRVFEALMSGALLLTEESENGLGEIFVQGQHLELYKRGNVEEAAEKIAAALSDLPRSRAIGRAGRDEILSRHLPIHRAERVLETLRGLTKAARPSRKHSIIANYSWACRVLTKIDSTTALRAAAAGMKALEEALAANEPVTEDLACHSISCCVEFDRLLKSDAGEKLIDRYIEAHPELNIPKLCKIWMTSRRGETEITELLLRELNQQTPEQALPIINQLMENVVAGGY